MMKKEQQIKFRLESAMKRRLKWAMYCEDLDSQQDVMIKALDYWLSACEKKYGPPQEPRAGTHPAPRAGGKL